MQTIWIVYSDEKASYDAGGIFVAAFSTKELALEYMARFGRSYQDSLLYVEECKLDSEQ